MIRLNRNLWQLWLIPSFLISSIYSTNNSDLYTTKNGLRVNIDKLGLPPNLLDNFTDIDLTVLDQVKRYCQRDWSCNSGGGDLCYCDDLCLWFDDCCDGKYHQNSTKISTAQKEKENEKLSLQQQIYKPLSKNVYTCPPYRIGDSNIYTIVGCPEEYPDNYVRKNCEHPNKTDKIMHVPVSGVFPKAPINSLSVKFYNLYCAICHGLTDYKFWNPTLDCKKDIIDKYYPEGLTTGNYSFDELRKHCKSSFEKPQNENLRTCKNMIDKCPTNTNSFEASLCTEGANRPIISGLDRYKNIGCALCHNVHILSLSCMYRFSLESAISELYNFNSKKIFPIENCDTESIFDPYTNKCRQIISSRFCNESNLIIEDPMVSCPDCKLIKLDKNEYGHFDGYIRLNKSNLIINISLLHYIDNNIYVCSKHYITKNMSTDRLDDIEHYITLFGLSLSILALFVTFCVYASFPSLRNIPGKMSMNLVASMFIANLLFLLKSLNVICILTAISIHYTYLVSFFWMNALSFDAWNTFTKKTIGGRSKHCYKYYLIYCWITPLLIVSFSIFVNFSPFDIFPSWLSPKYGPPLCWISNKWALLIFFAAPLFLLILSNVVFYILTIRTIYRTEKYSDRMLSKKNKGMFLIYLKLCFIMGINWIFALLHALTGITVIRFISVVLVSFQGFLIGCSYLFSKQIWRQLKSKIISLRIYKGYSETETTESKQTSVLYLSHSKDQS